MDNYQTVAAYTTAIEAHIVKRRMEVEGIPAVVQFEHHVWANWSLSVALGGVRVQVPHSYLDESVNLLENLQAGMYEAVIEEQTECFESIVCPECGSEPTSHVNWSSKLALVVMFMIFLPVPYSQHWMKCQDCSHQWIAVEQRGYSLHILLLAFLHLWALFFIVYVVWFHLCSLYCEHPQMFY
ncbi:MAG: hypothetical protein JKY89_12150 [Immundisolibacteraceae bacterium]|nr:hypothetical protein [Immundisolibacteraceae bacterium]